MSSDELRRVFQSFDTDLFQDVVDRVREHLGSVDVSIEGPSKDAKIKYQRCYFIRQTEKRGMPQYIREQLTKIVRTIDRFPDERWHEYSITRGPARFLVFVNEAGVGRACLDLTTTNAPEAGTVARDESKMKYIRVAWKHKDPDDPVMFYSELDETRWEWRRIEVYHDGRRTHVSVTEESPGSTLCEYPVPELEEIADSQLEPAEITREEFEAQWAARKHAL